MRNFPRPPVFRNRPIAALAVICLSVFVISVDATIVNVALPTLSRQLNADTAQLQWIVDAYTLVMAGLLLSVGSLSDRFGRRGWLSGGLVVFAMTSAVAAQVNSTESLIAARAAMGVGAAVIFPTTLGLITNIFTDAVPRAKAIGVWAAMVGVGVAAGPMTGGWLLEHFAWGSIFLVNVPVAATAIVGGILFVPTSRDPAAPKVDMPGLILSCIGVTAVVYTVIEAPAWGWGSARAAAGFGIAIAVLAAFGLWERHSSHPMLDISVFADRRFSGGSLAVTAGFLTLFGFIFVITQYFQFIKSYSAFETGVRLLPVAVSIAVASVLGPRMVERVGTRAVVAAGLAIFAAGLAWASTADAATPYLQIAAQMVLLGGGLGLTIAPATEAIMGSLSTDKAGIGSAVNDTTRELGGTLGVAIVGSVFASVYSSRIGSASALTALPRLVRSTMEHSTAAAYKVIGQLPAVQAAGVRDAVNHAFLGGMQIGSLVCAAIALGAAIIVAALLPARPTTSPQPDRSARIRARRRMKGKDMNSNEIPEKRYTERWSEGRGEVKFATRSDGSRLRYFTAGTGPPLVLLHTVRTQLDYFQRVIPGLWDAFTVYALDLPGMGWSDIVAGAGYEEPDLRAAVVEFITALDLHEATLAGESLGAAIALSASVQLDDRVSRVVAFNSYDYPSGLERGNWFARLIGTSIRLPGSGPVFARLENRPILKGVLRGGFVDASKLPKDFLIELRRSGSRNGYPRVARAIMRNLNGLVQGRPRYAEVAVPVTLVYSEQDWSHPAERDQVASLLADVQRIAVPDIGHFSALERPADMVRILRHAAGIEIMSTPTITSTQGAPA